MSEVKTLSLPFKVGEVVELKSCSIASEILPILWFGEKTEPVVRGYGRLVAINGQPAIQRLIWSDRLDQDITPLTLPETYIICGGVEPQVHEVFGYVKIVRSAEIPSLQYSILPASGVGYKTYALLCSQSPVEILEHEPIESFEAYNPPFVWWVDVEKKTVKCIASP